MSIHDITDTRQKAAAILSGRKLQMLEESGLMVVEVETMKRLVEVLERAPSPRKVDHDEYWQWYENELDQVQYEVERMLREVRRGDER